MDTASLIFGICVGGPAGVLFSLVATGAGERFARSARDARRLQSEAETLKRDLARTKSEAEVAERNTNDWSRGAGLAYDALLKIEGDCAKARGFITSKGHRPQNSSEAAA